MANPQTELVITMADGEKVEVQTTLEDRLAFETALRKNRSWGKLEDNALKLQPFMAWNAAVRTGKTDLTWSEFTTGDTAALAVDVPEESEESEDDDDLEVEGVGKDTKPEPSTSPASPSPETTAAPRGNGAAKKPRS